MRVYILEIFNFRGIESAEIFLPTHGALIGDNNVGKTTIFEALNLVLGPDRLNRQPPIDEHDFFQGKYHNFKPDKSEDGENPEESEEGLVEADSSESKDDESESAEDCEININVLITDLNEEQRSRFGNNIEFWDTLENKLYDGPNPEEVDGEHIIEVLRVTFLGWYEPEVDDFEGHTYFARDIENADDRDNLHYFSKKDKQICGFLYLRSLRTGSRALSMERGSLLDIILRLKEIRPKIWEDTIDSLMDYTVASDPALGISGVLESIDSGLKKYVPREWGSMPQLKISNLTREHLRKVITAFIATGEGDHVAPFYRQGTGTINMLVLAMLSQIAEDKQNVIFAMEEPETAIPPYAQKQIVHQIKKLASQTLFTSHSPYVLEEFTIEEIVVLKRDETGKLEQREIELPDGVKPHTYRQNFRTRFCEGLLARRILIAEGATEASAFPLVCRRLSELEPTEYNSLESLGICTIDAGGEGNISDMAKIYNNLGKFTFAICDKQGPLNQMKIELQVKEMFMHDEKNFEDLVINNTTEDALKRFSDNLEWPPHLKTNHPDPKTNIRAALKDYFNWSKAKWGIANFLAQCSLEEIPEWLRTTCKNLTTECQIPTSHCDSENTIEKFEDVV